jgi:hypothetical protein
MMNLSRTIFLFLLVVLPFPGHAQTIDDVKVPDGSPAVVELFTSTNCSACIEADRILYDISKKKNVIALGCHIDYWDENTMKDPTGLEACTYRQWTYKASGMMSGTDIRVPHFVINGDRSVDQGRLKYFYTSFLAAIGRAYIHQPLEVQMKWKDQETLYVTMPETNKELDDKDSYSVWLIRYQDSLIKKIEDGQTAGRVLRFTNVVKSSEHIAKWHGEKRTIEVDVDKPLGGPDRGGYVVIIHEINGSNVIAAGKLADFKMKDAAKKPAAETPTTPSQ